MASTATEWGTSAIEVVKSFNQEYVGREFLADEINRLSDFNKGIYKAANIDDSQKPALNTIAKLYADGTISEGQGYKDDIGYVDVIRIKGSKDERAEISTIFERAGIETHKMEVDGKPELWVRSKDVEKAMGFITAALVLNDVPELQNIKKMNFETLKSEVDGILTPDRSAAKFYNLLKEAASGDVEVRRGSATQYNYKVVFENNSGDLVLGITRPEERAVIKSGLSELGIEFSNKPNGDIIIDKDSPNKDKVQGMLVYSSMPLHSEGRTLLLEKLGDGRISLEGDHIKISGKKGDLEKIQGELAKVGINSEYKFNEGGLVVDADQTGKMKGLLTAAAAHTNALVRDDVGSALTIGVKDLNDKLEATLNSGRNHRIDRLIGGMKDTLEKVGVGKDGDHKVLDKVQGFVDRVLHHGNEASGRSR